MKLCLYCGNENLTSGKYCSKKCIGKYVRSLPRVATITRKCKRCDTPHVVNSCRTNFICDECKEKISTLNKNHLHENFVVDGENCICNICQGTFSQHGIKTHIWRSHGDGKSFKPASGLDPWNKGKTKDSDNRILVGTIKITDKLIKRGIENRATNIHRLSEYNRYKNDCQFRFSLNQYPDKFDFNLIKQHGWYKASNRGNNPTGVSRDHIVSIKYGWENNIPSSIISHPANCQLLQQSINSKKKAESWLTIDELRKRIENWDSGASQSPIKKPTDEIDVSNREKKKPRHMKGVCVECGLPCSTNAKTKHCINCHTKHKHSHIPSMQELVSDLLISNPVKLRHKYGVSDTAIRKWMVSYGIPTQKKEWLKFIYNIPSVV